MLLRCNIITLRIILYNILSLISKKMSASCSLSIRFFDVRIFRRSWDQIVVVYQWFYDSIRILDEFRKYTISCFLTTNFATVFNVFIPISVGSELQSSLGYYSSLNLVSWRCAVTYSTRFVSFIWSTIYSRYMRSILRKQTEWPNVRLRNVGSIQGLNSTHLTCCSIASVRDRHVVEIFRVEEQWRKQWRRGRCSGYDLPQYKRLVDRIECYQKLFCHAKLKSTLGAEYVWSKYLFKSSTPLCSSIVYTI